jgi:hypothetical protein
MNEIRQPVRRGGSFVVKVGDYRCAGLSESHVTSVRQTLLLDEQVARMRETLEKLLSNGSRLIRRVVVHQQDFEALPR